MKKDISSPGYVLLLYRYDLNTVCINGLTQDFTFVPDT